jgi:hypothetical protein
VELCWVPVVQKPHGKGVVIMPGLEKSYRMVLVTVGSEATNGKTKCVSGLKTLSTWRGKLRHPVK